MIEILESIFIYFWIYRYLAIFVALTAAGFGVPIPEELTLILGGYLTAIGQLELLPALLVCYAGVIAGDIVTYTIGRFFGSRFLESRYAEWVMSRTKLEQVQYYFRGYGPYYLLGARQIAGLRFPSFFTAGMLKMRFSNFLLFDGLAAFVSMPVVFSIAYYFGPQLRETINLILRIRNVTFLLALTVFALGTLVFGLYWYFYRYRKPT
ncbi:MAG: DedA family protein [bacterium]